uniref:Uncharacterized protein n=1 Tax=viral metagenome TaxID=1070528 RepID=A0A6C0DEF0_9ZZZZ
MEIIYSKGFQQSITNDGSSSKPVINEIEWDANADYKKKKGIMNVNINKNGKTNNYQVKLTKNDLENILKMPTVNRPLDQRLIHDFQVIPKYNGNKTRKNMRNIPKHIITRANNENNNEYDDLEDLFALRKKLMMPYHLTHHGTINKTQKARQAHKQGKKKVNNKSRKDNKAKGVTKLFNQFF